MKKDCSNRVNIVCGCDDEYTLPLSVSMHSVLRRVRDKIEIRLFILSDNIKSDNKRNIFKRLNFDNLSIKFIDPNLERISNLNKDRHLTRAAYLRLMVGDILKSDIKKIIYLDCDLVAKRDIYKLWSRSVKDFTLLAVQDYGSPYSAPSLGMGEFGIANYKELGIDPNSPYFNSGVMLINLERWRKKNIGCKSIRYVEENISSIRAHDQEALNVVVDNDWGRIDPRWNVQRPIYNVKNWPDTEFKSFMIERREEIIKGTHILHYIGTPKPWTCMSSHPTRKWFFDELNEMK